MSRVLVLDDDEVSLSLITSMLQTQGHTVRTATGSQEAWALLQEAPPDLLILDTELGTGNGADFLERVRGDLVFAELAVLVYSSISRRDVVRRYLELGVQGILIKPYSASRLQAELERLSHESWRDRLFEPASVVRGRVGGGKFDLGALYRRTAEEISVALGDLDALADDLHNPVGLARLDELKAHADTVGCLVLLRLAQLTEKAVLDADEERTRELVGRFATVVRLLLLQAGPAAARKATPATVSTLAS